MSCNAVYQLQYTKSFLSFFFWKSSLLIQMFYLYLDPPISTHSQTQQIPFKKC